MTRSLSGLILGLLVASGIAAASAVAATVSKVPPEGWWIGRFFGSDRNTGQAAPSAFCGVHRSSFQEVYFQFGRVDAVLADEHGFRLELAGGFIGRNFIGDVRLTDGKGLELLGPAKGVLGGGGEARISFSAKDLAGLSDRVCHAVLHLKKASGGN